MSTYNNDRCFEINKSVPITIFLCHQSVSCHTYISSALFDRWHDPGVRGFSPLQRMQEVCQAEQGQQQQQQQQEQRQRRQTEEDQERLRCVSQGAKPLKHWRGQREVASSKNSCFAHLV